MSMLLSDEAIAHLHPARRITGLPMPMRMVSNGEFTPSAPTSRQIAVENRIRATCAVLAQRSGMPIQRLLATPLARANAFHVMNAVHGAYFDVPHAETTDQQAAQEAADARRSDFIFDDQVHFLCDEAAEQDYAVLSGLIRMSVELLGLPMDTRDPGLSHVKLAQFIQEIFVNSDTKVALLSSSPSDPPHRWFLTNDEMANARRVVNEALQSERLLTHAVFTPRHPGWLDEMDRVHSELKPAGWKAYTIGEPFTPSTHRWRLDDEKLAYPSYARMVAAGVRNIAVHKGLLPADHARVLPGAEPFADVSDVGKAAKDWPELNFIIYHAGYRTMPRPTEEEEAEFERTGRIDWVTELSEIPALWNVNNVYADLGACFAFTVVTSPRLCAGMLGQLVRGLGADHILWGTDSVWYGSPQWQIDAFRRFEIPPDLRKKFGYGMLGRANGPVKQAILGANAARLYAIDPARYADVAAPTQRAIEAARSRFSLLNALPPTANGYAMP